MITVRQQRSIKLKDQVLQILRSRAAINSEIAAELGVTSALVCHYTKYLLKTGQIVMQNKVMVRGNMANLWVAVKEPQEDTFSWIQEAVPGRIKPMPARAQTNWVGGNPYERLAA